MFKFTGWAPDRGHHLSQGLERKSSSMQKKEKEEEPEGEIVRERGRDAERGLGKWGGRK